MKVTIKSLNGTTSHGVVNQDDLFHLLDSFKDKPFNVLIMQQDVVDDILEAINPLTGESFGDKNND